MGSLYNMGKKNRVREGWSGAGREGRGGNEGNAEKGKKQKEK